MLNPKLERIFEPVLVVGAPLLLAIVEIFHPHAHDLLDLNVQRWLAVHYAQIPLFALSALAVVTLVRNQTSLCATLCRAAMFVFAISYIAFDTAAGVVTGILVTAARQTGDPEQWRAPIYAIWKHPIVGGSPSVTAPLLALLGAVALAVGGVSAAIALKRSGTSWAPVALLAMSSFGIVVFKTHAWPGGPLTFAGLAVAGAWVLWERARTMRANIGGKGV